MPSRSRLFSKIAADVDNAGQLTLSGLATDVSEEFSGGAGGGSFEVTAKGSITAGDTLVFNKDGTVSSITNVDSDITSWVATRYSGNVGYAQQLGGFGLSGEMNANGEDVQPEWSWAGYDPYEDAVLSLYEGLGNHTYGRVFSIPGIGANSQSTPNTPTGNIDTGGEWVSDAIKITDESIDNGLFGAYIDHAKCFLISWRDITAGVVAVIVKIKNGRISYGRVQKIETSTVLTTQITYDKVQKKAIVWYNPYTVNDRLSGRVIYDIDGERLDFKYGPEVQYTDTIDLYFSAAYHPVENRHVGIYSSSSNLKAIAAKIEGTSITFGTPITLKASESLDDKGTKLAAYNPLHNCILAVGRQELHSIVVDDMSLSGTYITTASTTQRFVACDAYGKGIVIGGGASNHLTFEEIRMDSASSFSVQSETEVHDQFPDEPGLCYVPSRNCYFFTYGYNADQWHTWISITRNTTNIDNSNYAGIAADNYDSGATATVLTIGSTSTNHSGMLKGEYQYVKADGTLTYLPVWPQVQAGYAVDSDKLLIGVDPRNMAQ